jgi:hypothetical protein
MARYSTAAIYSSMLAAVVSAVMEMRVIWYPVRFVLAGAVGASISYIIIPLAEHSFSTHMGYTLFNYGFAGGLIALVIASVLRAMGADISTKNFWALGVEAHVLGIMLFLILLFFWQVCGCAGGLLVCICASCVIRAAPQPILS